MASLERLLDVLLPLGPVEATSGFDSQLQSVTIRIADRATPIERDVINAAILAFDWSQAAEDAWILTRARNHAVQAFITMPVLRAIVLSVTDEINILRGLAGLQVRTTDQVRNAIFSKINTGEADL